MYRIIDNRATGKTEKLMIIAKETNATFVCADPHAMKIKAAAYGITDIDFISYGAYLTRKKDDSNIVIDEIESFLNYISQFNANKGKIIGYTLSLEE